MTTLIEVNPVGRRSSIALVGAHTVTVSLPVYPESPEGRALRTRRRNARVSLSRLACELQITPSALSKVEEGQLRPENPQWWSDCHAVLDAMGVGR